MRESKLFVEAQAPVVPGLPGEVAEPPRGELTFIDNTVDVTTGRIKLKATFPNSDNTLCPGQFVQTILTLNILKHATLVLSQGVQSSQSGDFVFVVKSDSTVQKRAIVAGLPRRGMTVIESGVQSGETVVTDGQLRLTEGAPVTAQPLVQRSSASAD